MPARESVQRSLAAYACAWLLALAGCTNNVPQAATTPDATATMAIPVTMMMPAPAPPPAVAGQAAAGTNVMPVVVPSAGTSAGAPPIVPVALDAGMPEPDDDAGSADAGAIADAAVSDAGPWRSPDLQCENGDWKLATGLLLAQQVDYVADRDFREMIGGGADTSTAGAGGNGGERQFGTIVLSSAGMACATANNRMTCEDSLALQSPVSRHLVTTKGNTVTIWLAPSALKLLGLIDTPAEALWWAMANYGAKIDCDVTIVQKGSEYVINGVKNNSCYLPDSGYHETTEMVIRVNGQLGIPTGCAGS